MSRDPQGKEEEKKQAADGNQRNGSVEMEQVGREKRRESAHL